MLYYKILRADNRSGHGGSGAWRRNRWRGVSGTLVPCERGLHLCRVQDLPVWVLEGGRVWEAEYDGDGECLECYDKVVVRRARVVRLVGTLTPALLARLARECAERAAGYAAAADDDAVRAARAADDAAAYAAYAADAGGGVAGWATRAAARAADAAHWAARAATARAATDDDAAAVYAAARAAAYAAYAAERAWQGARLLELLAE